MRAQHAVVAALFILLLTACTAPELSSTTVTPAPTQPAPTATVAVTAGAASPSPVTSRTPTASEEDCPCKEIKAERWRATPTAQP